MYMVYSQTGKYTGKFENRGIFAISLTLMDFTWFSIKIQLARIMIVQWFLKTTVWNPA